MWRWLDWLGYGFAHRAASDAVRRTFAAAYPDRQLTGIRLRAREADRDVVAATYREHGALPHRGMPRYELFAVRADLTVERLDGVDHDSPYHLRGIK